MAAAPLAEHKGEHKPEPAPDNGVSLAEAVACQEEGRTWTLKKGTNPIADLFGSPTFAMGESNVYPDAKIAGKTSQRVAHVLFDLRGLTFQASIYMETQIKGDASGRWSESSIRFSLPKGAIIVDKSRPEVAVLLEAWKSDILDGYEKWAATLAESTPVQTSNRGNVRLVKRQPLQDATAK